MVDSMHFMNVYITGSQPLYAGVYDGSSEISWICGISFQEMPSKFGNSFLSEPSS